MSSQWRTKAVGNRQPAVHVYDHSKSHARLDYEFRRTIQIFRLKRSDQTELAVEVICSVTR